MISNPRVTPIYLTWLNYLGGFDYFLFLSEKEFQLSITGSEESRKNIFPQWPQSYSETADTIDRRTSTTAKDVIVLKSQHLTANQRDGLKYIKTSPVVQIVTSRRSRTTVLVDIDSYKIYDEGDDLYTVQFTLRYTNDVPTQRV